MVNKKLLLIQEIETFYIIPSIRKHFAQFLKEEGMKQKDIAEIFDVSTAAVSQYISSKRGNNVNFSKDTLKEIKKSSKNIKTKKDYIKETQNILRFLSDNQVTCQIHQKFSNIAKHCKDRELSCHKRF